MGRASWMSALAACCGLVATANGGEEGPEKVFVGYVYGSTEGIDFQLYTHLCHAFLTADGDGKVNASRGVPNKELTTKAHEAGVKVLLSLGGWGWDDQFASIMSKKESEDRYVEAVMKAVEAGDYDGIDLDWEYPDSEKEVEGFERLTRRLRAALDDREKATGREMAVTMAASCNEGTLKWLGTEFLTQTMDWVNVMTYDMAGEWTDYAGHHSPLFPSSRQPGGSPRSSAGAIEYLLNERKLPADKIALGIPLYGKGFAVKEPYASTKGAPRLRRGEGGGGFARLEKLRTDQGWKRVMDDETKVPWLLAPDGHAVIGYDDAESVAAKAAWAREKGIRGVFFWEIGHDRMPDGSHPLQEAARKSLMGEGAKP